MKRSYWVGGKRVRVKLGPDVAAAAGILVIMPCAANATALLEDDKILDVVALDEVDCTAHA